ncbi:AAEL015121-PA [Aedes aegypti]|uniref:AAEL015121-PA n=1 Tax=Aedes aegypti TaxID=7159 RepID=Q1DH47_AEDAE|nr:AAEL015121-PA [Aedes aegypti]
MVNYYHHQHGTQWSSCWKTPKDVKFPALHAFRNSPWPSGSEVTKNDTIPNLIFTVKSISIWYHPLRVLKNCFLPIEGFTNFITPEMSIL